MSILNKKFVLINKKKSIVLSSVLLFFILTIISSFFYIKSKKPPEIEDLATIEFYTSDKQKFFELNNEQNQTYVPLSEISPYMLDAIISIEDQHFYNHHGFDYKRIVKSIIDNVAAMNKSYGASTITQQYAKNLYLSNKKTFQRKLREAYYTILLEGNYSKDEILEGYLNTIYFGHGIYGVADASKFYFNKEAKELTVAEAAVLAAIPKAPSYYSPIANFDKNKLRKELVLKEMLKQNYITPNEYNEALHSNIHITGIHPQSNYDVAPYFQDILIKELASYDLNQDQFFKGVKVYTTLDSKLNQIINESIDEIYPQSTTLETAVYAIDPNNGFVRAVVGGRDYRTSQYNRALAGQRHPGSTIKPILYYSALEYGFTPATTFKSEPTTFYVNHGTEAYSPSNFRDLYAYKDITMAYALAVSDNIYAVKTHLFLGENRLIKSAQRFGITANMLPVPSLALGSTEVKLSELTTAYAHFASLGEQVKPVYITKITDLENNVLYEYTPVKKQVLNPDLCFIMNHMLNGIFDTRMQDYTSVTGLSIAYRLTHKYAGKSGSTDFDSTMVGFNPKLALGVWSGYDDMVPITDYAEKGYSKRLWATVMEKYFKDQETGWYEPTDHVVPLIIDPITGRLSSRNTPGYKKMMYFIKGTQPHYS